MRHDEAARQIAVIKWWDLKAKSFGVHKELLWHTPNGGRRSIPEAIRFKQMGVRRGVPDLFLAVPRGEAHGLFIEMKSARGAVSQEQTIMRLTLEAQGYQVEICRSFSEASAAIIAYLSLSKSGDTASNVIQFPNQGRAA